MTSKTSCLGASKRRVMRISWSETVVTVKLSLLALLASMTLLLLVLLRFAWLALELVEVIAEPFEPPLPEVAIMLRPVGDGGERRGLDAARPPLRVDAPRDEPRTLEHLQGLGDGREAHVEGRCELGHRALARHEAREDRAARRVGEGGKGGAERVGSGHGRVQPQG